MGFLRWLLAISVLSAHSGPIFGIKMFDAISAVKVFFVISGFYMTLVLTTKYKFLSDLRGFYFNRFLRLYPAYFIILLVTFWAMRRYNLVSLHEFSDLPWPSFITVMASNLLLFGQDWLYFFYQNQAGYFLPGIAQTYETLPARFTVAGVSWTLGLECTFYLLAPFFVRMRIFSILTIILFLVMIRNYFIPQGIDAFQYRFFPFELPLFLSGMIAYRIYEKIKVEKKWLYIYLTLLPIIFLLMQNIKFCGLNHFYQLIIYAIPGLFHITKNISIDTLIGEFSYPIYLSHYFIMNYFPSYVVHHWSVGYEFLWRTPLGFGGMLLILSMIFSIPLIMLDKYLDKWRAQRQKNNDITLPEGVVSATQGG